MTEFRQAPYGRTSRTRMTFWIDDPLIPVLKQIADDRPGVSQADVVNTGLYQLEEVQKELQKDTHTQHEDINQETNRGEASPQA